MTKNNNLPLIFKGCSENNLKNIDVELPANKLIVITGLSGSGKSSLAFHTIYAEGQRRYIETFSPYTRQFLDKLKKPEILYSENMRPAIAIEQKTRIRSARSTVGSMTHCKELLKSIWPHLATLYCPKTKKPLKRFEVSDVASETKKLVSDKNTLLIASEIKLSRKKEDRRSELEDLTQKGFNRFMDPKSFERFKFNQEDNSQKIPPKVFVLLDRIKGKFREEQVKDSIEQAYTLTNGFCSILKEDEKKEFEIITFNRDYILSNGEVAPKPKAQLFDYNNPLGACIECKGFGKVLEIDPEKIIDNPKLSLTEDAVSCWKSENRIYEKEALLKFAKKNKISITKPWNKLTKKQQELILNSNTKDFKGPIAFLKKLERKSYKMHVRVMLARYRSEAVCCECNGKRLQEFALNYKINNYNIADIWNIPVSNALSWIESVYKENAKTIDSNRELQHTFLQLKEKLKTLVNLGLPYLSLNRQAKTLSGGETQRVNLVTALGSRLVSTTFVLDEPSVGLHPKDSDMLLAELKKLKNAGNNVVVVEHDLDFINHADLILELGPKAGSAGGEISYFGNQKNWPGIKINKLSNNDEYKTNKFIEIKNANFRNLKNINIKLPLENFCVLSGVSGSGKSTLVEEVILDAYKHDNTKVVSGLKEFKQVLLINQNSLAKSPRANIATYSGIWDVIRKRLSQEPLAQSKLLTASSFSFNTEGGRCPTCKGVGYIKEDMQFLSDVYVTCEDCQGRRFLDSILEVKFLDKNVSEWLNTTVKDCEEILYNEKGIFQICNILVSLGLGHLRLGHSLSELSGGEAQRLKLIPFLEKAKSNKSFLIFDEPTTGLHYYDVLNLIEILKELVRKGHTVLCIEHNQEVILESDYIIDLGPEGGENGGEVVLCGTPKDFLKASSIKKSITAFYLNDYANSYKKGSKKAKVKKVADSKTKEIKSDYLSILGAKEHNLKNLNIDLKHDTLTAFTGVSGSGKSSIAKDIVFAEGQRRYLDCLSPYARQFLRELKQPDIDNIENVRPSICVEQNTTQVGKRATLATISEVYSFLRLLFNKTGVQHCPDHPEYAVATLSTEQIAKQIKDFGDKTVRLIAPVIQNRKGEHKDVFRRARATDISEVRVNGVFAPIAVFEDELERHKTHDIDYVWGKFIPKRLPLKMIISAVEEVLALGTGQIVANIDDKDFIFSKESACPVCNSGFYKLSPEDFSYLSTRGRCKACNGFGINIAGKKCTACNGTKINKLARNVKILNKNIHDTVLMNTFELSLWLDKLKFENNLIELANPLKEEIKSRLNTLSDLGLGYLPLDESVLEIASGELQRLRLAAALGSPLTGAMYIFDEPSAGLHPSDNEHVLEKLKELKEQGNSVLLIEHDLKSILSADRIVELGPEGGNLGGEIVFNGTKDKFIKQKRHKLTESYKQIVKKDFNEFLKIKKGNINNLKNLEVSIPLKNYVCVAGVSGAGKSSLVEGLILNTIEIEKRGANNLFKSEFAEISSSIPIDRLLQVDQSPIGKNSRSTPVSYLKIWDEIRKLFAKTYEARAKGWGAGYFSYNGGKGACKECKGLGEIKLDISFLNQARVKCDVCQGDRYTEETLKARYRNLNINEVLKLTFEEAKSIFANHKKIHKALHLACELGLGYLTLGQSAPTLSGGESQRIKLSLELAKVPNKHTLYIFDEPSRGLHRKDVMLLIQVFRSLTEQGHSVIVIEHDDDILKASDYLIELGPKAGAEGGKIVYQGLPKNIKKTTPWGKILRNEESFIAA